MEFTQIIFVVAIALVYLAACYGIMQLKKRKKSFNFRVLTALGVGLVLGAIIQTLSGLMFGEDATEVIGQTTTFLSVFGSGYVALLKILVIPLIFVAMISSVMNIKGEGSLSRIVPKVLTVLIVTVSIAALVGIGSSMIFGLDDQAVSLVEQSSEIYGHTGECPSAEEIAAGATQSDVCRRVDSLNGVQGTVSEFDYSDLILGFIPSNIFYMLTGQESTATLSTVFVGMFVGYAVMQVRKRKPEKVETFVSFIEASKEVVLSMVREILKLTPYGVMALMAIFMSTNNYSQLSFFVWFIVASYAAIIVMYLIHLAFVALMGLNPIQFAKKTYSVLLFGFTSRSSMATLPLNIEAQEVGLGVDTETANISATFGTSIGQNGCAGIYPAMVALMSAFAMAASVGSEFELTIGFVVKLIVVIAISSFGIAGVGGGATFAAVAVLTIMGLDLTYVALLVAIEPLIDMARTALNVSDSMLAGVLTAKSNKTLDEEVYNTKGVNLDGLEMDL